MRARAESNRRCSGQAAARHDAMNPTSTIADDTRELIVQLRRGNGDPARALAGRVQADLNVILSSDLEAASTLWLQAQQTMYAIEEVLTLIEQRDLPGACQSARDASKEWRVIAQTDSEISGKKGA